ncbi:hypothetical protein H310_02277 [Aphanomyces invadans]|uniref:Endopeptidase S2P n=1 Tax=Aphanomyces invadans TaxID=157072 RepID=A0A024UNV1_9STRA|nr:hypothetical protein H310_02277 [Aphanomyces invadans]ETW07855.1 hypothetical protein H310_02277 [Aphanomyces invadans]|eukprot:XP_008863948.1 hypothetical protein H310_02277 [Aphanomyces invadans]
MLATWLLVVAVGWAVTYSVLFTASQGNANIDRNTLHVLPAFVSKEFTWLNEWVFQLGRRHPIALKAWFTAGSVVAAILMVGSSAYVVWNAMVLVARHIVQVDVEAPLPTTSVMLPGVNMPLHAMWYLWIAIFLAASFHEFGHALAAALCEIRMVSVGVFLAVVFPGAYVRFDSYYNIGVTDQIKIQSAGIWHNAVMALVCMLQLWILPTLLSPWFATHRGLTVTSMPEFSNFEGLLDIGNVIVSIDHAPTLTLSAWEKELAVLAQVVDQPNATWKQVGYCIPFLELLQHGNRDDSSCCHADNGNTDSALQCFAHGDGDESTGTPPPAQMVCLDGNRVGQVSIARCTHDLPCHQDGVDKSSHVCVLPKMQDGTSLIRIGLRSNRTLVVHGYPPDLHAELHLSPYSQLAPATTGTFWWLSLPTWIERFWQFVGNVSGTLGLFNALPIHHFDGSHLCASYLQLLVADEPTRAQALSTILIAGDVLVVVAGVLSLWPL